MRNGVEKADTFTIEIVYGKTKAFKWRIEFPIAYQCGMDITGHNVEALGIIHGTDNSEGFAPLCL